MRSLTVSGTPSKGFRADKVRMPGRESAKPPYLKAKITKSMKLSDIWVKNRLKIPHIKGFRKVDDGPPKHCEAVRKA